MRSLRDKLPSGSALTALQNHDSFRDEYGMSMAVGSQGPNASL
jgi:hypothetical protein